MFTLKYSPLARFTLHIDPPQIINESSQSIKKSSLSLDPAYPPSLPHHASPDQTIESQSNNKTIHPQKRINPIGQYNQL